MEITTQAYTANPDAYIKEMRVGYRDFLSLFDANTNNKIEIDEHVRSFKVFGHMSDAADIESFKVAYNSTNSVSLESAVNITLQFRTGTMTTSENDAMDMAVKTVLRGEL